MKTANITVNKSADKPEGVEIEIVQPEGPLEERFMIFTLRQLIKSAADEKRLSFDLPDGYQVIHQKDGSFVVAGFQAGDEQQQQGGYYQPPAPLAVVGLRTVGNQFDMIHAKVDTGKLQEQQQQQANASKDSK